MWQIQIRILAMRMGTFLGVLFLALMTTGNSVLADDLPLDREGWKARYRRPETVPHPPSNPWSAAKEELGRALFFDPLLSGAMVRSCATCHNPSLSWGDGLSRAMGEGQKSLPLRSPTILNMAWLERYGWDGKFPDLESVAFVPIAGKGNMNADEETVVRRLSSIPGYRALFKAAFPGGDINRRNMELALGVYQRTVVSGIAPFDRWVAGDQSAIGDRAKQGFDLFNGKAACAKCHEGWAFTDGSFHDIGLASAEAEPGRGKYFPSSTKLQHAFKTPTLRNVAARYPFMHDGTLASLAEVVDHYARGGAARPSRAEDVHPLNLTLDERSALVDFLETLTEEPRLAQVPVLPR